MFNSFPQAWCNVLTLNRCSIPACTHAFNNSILYLNINNDKINIENLKSSSLYSSFVSKIAKEPTTVKKHEDVFSAVNYQFNWKDIFLTPIEKTLNTKLREFQYKFFNRILYTNDMLYKFKKVQSLSCYLCRADIETLEHFLFCCLQVEVFWKEILSLFKDNLKITKCFEITDTFFGINKQDTYALLLNYIILKGNISSISVSLIKSLCLRDYY